MGEEKPVGAICLGTRVLAEHGYLNGRFVARTNFPDYFKHLDLKWGTNRVVTEKPFVTAGADRDAAQFVATLLPQLQTRK